MLRRVLYHDSFSFEPWVFCWTILFSIFCPIMTSDHISREKGLILVILSYKIPTVPTCENVIASTWIMCLIILFVLPKLAFRVTARCSITWQCLVLISLIKYRVTCIVSNLENRKRWNSLRWSKPVVCGPENYLSEATIHWGTCNMLHTLRHIGRVVGMSVRPSWKVDNRIISSHVGNTKRANETNVPYIHN